MGRVLILGGGLAGLFCALKLAPHPCTLLTPVPLGNGAASAWAQGGIAAAIGEGDSVALHVADTLRAGAGLCIEARVTAMAAEANARIEDLLAYGVPFDRDLHGRLVQSREAAHCAHRVVRVRGDQAGRAIMAALIAAVRATPSIDVIEDSEGVRLLEQGGCIRGVCARIGTQSVDLHADATVLATGGIGGLYALTTNPCQARGAGLVMAAQAGARISNAEFVQFHPTALDVGRDPAPLATEALRGEGAVLINANGHRFMADLHPDAELAPRDIVARGVFAEWIAGRRPMLDASAAIGAHFPEQFPGVYAACLEAGIDPVAAPMPIAPAAHYHMGGIETDAIGATRLPGLYAIGEVAQTGIHGANRLASNSLLEAAVFAARLADHLKADKTTLAHGAKTKGAKVELRNMRPHPAEPDESATIAALRATLTAHLGVIREGEGMAQAADWLADCAHTAQSHKVQAMAQAGWLVARSALARQESRGSHYRTDFRETRADYALDTVAPALDTMPRGATWL